MSIYDEPFMTLRQTAAHLRLSVLQVRRAVAIDPTTGNPGPNSAFPHAYKATPGRTSPVRIPRRDVDAFKMQQAGAREDGHYIYDEPYMTLSDAADALRLSMYQMRTILIFEPKDARPRPGSAFPHAYKEMPAVNSPIRIPLADIEAYKAERVGGSASSSNGHNAGNVPGESRKAAPTAQVAA